jgi:hypothetical protein
MALDYILRVTGDCENTGEGAVYIEPIGGEPPYDINWISPFYPSDLSVTSTTKTNLSSGTYQLVITDSTTPDDLERPFLFTISDSSFCVSISSDGTYCAENNGIIGVTADTSSNNVTYYLYNLDNVLINSATTVVGFNQFIGLSPDVYYVIAEDEGGCTAKTQTCSIKPSTDFDYELFVVDNSECFNATGRIFVVNQNSSGPYTYQWSNGETTQSISGLTSGQYSVTVTDKFGCSKTKITTVNTLPKPEFISWEIISPSCIASDGRVTFYLTGGTLPIKYFLSNGDSQILYYREVSFFGLPTGTYTVTAVDAGKCSASTQVSLTALDSFVILNVSVIKSKCNSNNGSVIIDIQGGAVPYNAYLYFEAGNYVSQTTSSNQIVFNNIPSGTHQLVITNSSKCFYEQIIVLENENKFSLTTTNVDTSCGENNGYTTLTITSGGSAPYIYQVGSQQKTSTLLTETFSNLSPGLYNVSVTDNDGCQQSTVIIIQDSEPVEFTIITQTCKDGDDAAILLLITSGEPPFTIDWSLNVGLQSGIYVTGLTEGDYFVVVTDNKGCKLKKTTKIFCGNVKESFKTFTLCEDIFETTPNTLFGVAQIYAQGFQDVTSGATCILTSAEFILEVIIGPNTYTTNLGTFNSLQNYPSEQEIIDAIRDLLDGIDGIGSVIIDLENNTISISTDCDKSLSAETVTINLKILYDFCCYETTTTTCDDCRVYMIENYSNEFMFTDCEGEIIVMPDGDFENPEFCAKSNQNILFGAPGVLRDKGCCECSNKVIQLTYSDFVNCPNFSSNQPGQLNLLYYVSGYTYPLSIGDFIYNDLCLKESADSGYYRDFQNLIIYHYNKINGIYQIDYC